MSYLLKMSLLMLANCFHMPDCVSRIGLMALVTIACWASAIREMAAMFLRVEPESLNFGSWILGVEEFPRCFPSSGGGLLLLGREFDAILRIAALSAGLPSFASSFTAAG